MKRLIPAVCIVISIGLIAHTWAQENEDPATQNASAEYFKTQGAVMKCSPPKFLLISEIDMDARTITGLSTIEIQTPKPVVSAFHLTFKFADVKLTNARRTAINEDQLKELKGQLIVMSEGREPLSAAYLGLFREDTIVMSVLQPKK